MENGLGHEILDRSVSIMQQPLQAHSQMRD